MKEVGDVVWYLPIGFVAAVLIVLDFGVVLINVGGESVFDDVAVAVASVEVVPDLMAGDPELTSAADVSNLSVGPKQYCLVVDLTREVRWICHPLTPLVKSESDSQCPRGKRRQILSYGPNKQASSELKRRWDLDQAIDGH